MFNFSYCSFKIKRISKVNTTDNDIFVDISDFTESISKELNSALKQCIECGKCVGSCTASRVAADYSMRKIIKKVIEKDESVLRDEMIWMCFLCGQCEMICPKKDMNLPRLIQKLREIAIQKGYAPSKLIILTDWLDKFFSRGKIAGPNQISSDHLKKIKEVGEKSGVNTLRKFIEDLNIES